MDLDKAMLDPASAFDHPKTILQHESLTREQKIKLLRRWEYDARELEVAADENMAGGPPSLLDEVLKALLALDVEIDSEHASPTKHGGDTTI